MTLIGEDHGGVCPTILRAARRRAEVYFAACFFVGVLFHSGFLTPNSKIYRRRCHTTVCASDSNRATPDPEAFLMAAEKLGVKPSECLVFEDTDMGIEAATAAGMASVKVPTR